MEIKFMTPIDKSSPEDKSNSLCLVNSSTLSSNLVISFLLAILFIVYINILRRSIVLNLPKLNKIQEILPFGTEKAVSPFFPVPFYRATGQEEKRMILLWSR